MQVNSLQQPVLDSAAAQQQELASLGSLSQGQNAQQPQLNQAFFAQQQVLQQQQMQRIQLAIAQQNAALVAAGGKSAQDTGRNYSQGKELQQNQAYPLGTSGSLSNGQAGSFGAFGYRRSHTKDVIQGDSQKSIKELGQKNGGDFTVQLPDKGTQFEMMRQSQQQQTVQPMIFNFFNSKNEVKQRNHNREQKGSDKGVIHKVYNNNQVGGSFIRGTSLQHASSQDYRGQKQAVSEICRATQIIQRKQDSQQASYMTTGGVTSYKDVHVGKTPTQKTVGQAAAGSQRYPPINQSSYNKTNLRQGGLQAQSKSNQYSNSKSVHSHKSRSSFNSQQPFPHKQQQQHQQQKKDQIGSEGVSSPPSAVKTQQQTKSTKFANIQPTSDIMKTMPDLNSITGAPNLTSQQLQSNQNQLSSEVQSLNRGLIVNTLKISQNGLTQSGQKQSYHQRQNTLGSDLLSQTHKTQEAPKIQNIDQLFDSNEFKRNGIRQIHPLKSYNQVSGEGSPPPLTSLGINKTAPNKTEIEPSRLMSVTQDQFRPSNGRHISQHNHQSSKVTTEPFTAIEVVQLYTTGGGSPTHSGLDHYEQAAKKKVNATNSSHHQWHLDPSQLDGRQGVSGSFIDTTQPAESSKLGTYPYQLVTTGHSMSNIGGYIQGNAIKDFCYSGPAPSQSNNYSWYGGANMRQPTKAPFHQHDSSSEKINSEVNKKLSQFSVQTTPAEENSKTANQRRQREVTRLTNDHSQLRRSGDYQSKIHKQISLDPVSQQLLLNKPQTSTEVISSDRNVVTSNGPDSKPAGTKTKFGVRVPPDLYQKNPYQPKFQVKSQRPSKQSSIESDRFPDDQQVHHSVMRSPQKPISRADSLQPSVYRHDARQLNQSSNLQSGQRKLQQNQRNIGLIAAGTVKNAEEASYSAALQNIQGSPLDPSIQQQRGQDSHNFFQTHSQGKGQHLHHQQYPQQPQQLPSFIKSNDGSTLMQQSPPSSGIQNIFADPNYGIGKVQQESMSASKNMATVGSSHLHSPREELKIMGFEETQAIRDMKALWLKNSGTGHHQGAGSSYANGENAPFNGLLETTNSGKSIPNSSIIRIQKSKYAGLIKQRGAQMPAQSSAGQDAMTAEMLTTENGFNSPLRQTQIQQINKLNQQRQGLLQQQSLKRVPSGKGGGGGNTSNRNHYEARRSGAETTTPAEQLSQKFKPQNGHNSSFHHQPQRLNQVARPGVAMSGPDQMASNESSSQQQESPKVASGSGTKVLPAEAAASMSTTKRADRHHVIETESSSSKSKVGKHSEAHRIPSGQTGSGKKTNASRSRGKGTSSKGAKTVPMSRADLPI